MTGLEASNPSKRPKVENAWEGKHSWDELIFEARETHERAVERGAYGTLYLRLAAALDEAQSILREMQKWA